ncbi:MAG: hypothetical protein ABSB28_01165 [Candidatus Bathyarchaeia archaeon]
MPEDYADMYIWKGKWKLPEGFGSKKEFRIFLGKNDDVVITDEHYSDRHGQHVDILQYAVDGSIERKLHCKTGDNFGKSFVKCLQHT